MGKAKWKEFHLGRVSLAAVDGSAFKSIEKLFDVIEPRRLS